MITKQTNKNKRMENSTKVSKLLPVSSVILAVHKIGYFGMLGKLKSLVRNQEEPLTRVGRTRWIL